MKFRFCFAQAWLACLLPWTAPAQTSRLIYAVVVSRHGVRSPTAAPGQLRQYSAAPWPEWGVEPGYLTPRGRKLMQLLGAYDATYFSGHALLRAGQCAEARRVYIWADGEQRTLESARAVAEGLLPGCGLEVHSKGEGERDPLFNGIQFGKADRAVALASVMGRIGGHPQELRRQHRTAFEALARVLGEPRPAWLDGETTVEGGKGDNLVDVAGPVRTASTIAENLLLEYLNGMKGKDLGWGRLDESNLREIMTLHSAYADLARRTPYIARARGSNLLSHVLESLRQAATGRTAAGALGRAGDALLYISGHDTNLSNLSGMLDLDWLLPGYAQSDTPPGGALVFELWRAAGGQMGVRVYYRAQTPDQMRELKPLTPASPPARAPLFIPGCGTAAEGYDCEWGRFERTVAAAIDPAFVETRRAAALGSLVPGRSLYVRPD